MISPQRQTIKCQICFQFASSLAVDTTNILVNHVNIMPATQPQLINLSSPSAGHKI